MENPAYGRDTVCAPASAPGKGAIAVIRISGPESAGIASGIFIPASSPDIPLKDRKERTLYFGKIMDGDKVIDEVTAVIFKAPRSYTGEDCAEIYCHGSPVIVADIIRLLIDNGAVQAEPGEFTKRAFLNGKMDLAQAEAVADVIASETRSARDVAIKQLRGGYSGQLGRMREEMLEIVTLMELELDFSEEDVEFAERKRVLELTDNVMEHIRNLKDSFSLGNAIKNGIPTAIAGAVNTGKSTLLNALLNEDRAIVSDIEGTTRDTIEDTININGSTFRFIDTAGIRNTSETIEMIGIERTWKTISKASIILMVLDATRPEYIGEALASLAPRISASQELYIILNKTDIVGPGTSGSCSSPHTALRYEAAQECKVANAAPEYRSQEAVLPYAQPAQDNNGLHASPASVKSSDTNENAGNETDRIIQAIGNEAKRNGLSPAAVIPISAKKHIGIENIKAALSGSAHASRTSSDEVMVTNMRHYQALGDALEALERVRDGLTRGISTEFTAQDLREALYHIGTITGHITSDEILQNVFRNFCIGK